MAGKNGKKPDDDQQIQPTLTEAQINQLMKEAEENPIAKAFSSESGFNAAKAMVELKEKIEQNALLLDVPSRKFAVAMKRRILRYRKYGCTDREEAEMIKLGLLAAIGGKRVRLFSDTVIGERSNQPFNKNNWADGVKNSLGFGDNNKK
jgi:hypothetical protein